MIKMTKISITLLKNSKLIIIMRTNNKNSNKKQTSKTSQPLIRMHYNKTYKSLK